MPPKGPRRTQGDWSWAETEVKKLEQITTEHCRRAAGLTGKICKPNFDTLPVFYENRPVPTTGDGKCTSAKCKESPTCYNHLGIEKIRTDYGSMDKYVDKQMEEEQVLVRKESEHVGLRNLGATCYANAFLQVWFHNTAFRNGVYRAAQSSPSIPVGSEEAQEEIHTPTYHLARLFASMELSDRAIVDPTPLLNSLELDMGVQQDAGEFAMLFRALLADSFKSTDPSRSTTILEDLFEGKMEHSTQCQGCGTTSSTIHPFLELEVHIEKGQSIEKCLANSTGLERLSGDNQYACPSCGSKQDALRGSRPSDLPPMINFTLVRFGHNGKKREKLKAPIKFGETIYLGGMRYELKAVVSHLGASATGGHFVCDVLEESSGNWLHCNDEDVDEESRTKRARREDPDDITLVRSSKDAYLLVYSRIPQEPAIAPPPDILAAVEADNNLLEKEMTDYYVKRKQLGNGFEHLQQAKTDVAEVLPGLDCFVPRKLLSDWLAAPLFDQLKTPWDISKYDCLHGAVDPFSTGQWLSISSEAHARLAILTKVPKLDICLDCVQTEWQLRRRKNDHQEQIENFDAELGDGRYLISSKWLTSWRDSRSKGLPTDPMFCEHGKRWDGGVKSIAISDGALAVLRSVVGEFPVFEEGELPCLDCSEVAKIEAMADKEHLDMLKKEAAVRRKVDQPFPPPFKMEFFVLPDSFYSAWEDWSKRGGDRPTLDMGICEHNKLDWDPRMIRSHWVDQTGWRSINEWYGPVQPIVVTYGPNPLPGKRVNIVDIDTEVCDECRFKRATAFETATLHVVFKRPENISVNHGRTTRSKGDSIAIEITKTMTVKDIKVKVCEMKGISPISQRMTYEGRELASDLTVEKVGILADDEVLCDVIEEDDDVLAIEPERAGFGGTALLRPRSRSMSKVSGMSGMSGIGTGSGVTANGHAEGSQAESQANMTRERSKVEDATLMDEAFARQVDAEEKAATTQTEADGWTPEGKVECPHCTYLNSDTQPRRETCEICQLPL